MKTSLIKKADLLIALVLVVAAVISVFCLRSGNGRIAIVEYNGNTLKEIDLDKTEDTYSFVIHGDLDVEITVSEAGICFSSSECGDKICMDFGVISQKGESAICLPAKVSIRISGGEIDGVTG